jgi:hypothetical protein
MTKLLNWRYNGKGALSVHIKSMYDIATKLKALGTSISYGELVQYIMAYLPKNYERRALDVNYAQVICIFFVNHPAIYWSCVLHLSHGFRGRTLMSHKEREKWGSKVYKTSLKSKILELRIKH